VTVDSREGGGPESPEQTIARLREALRQIEEMRPSWHTSVESMAEQTTRMRAVAERALRP
jgi:hypothetical protein